MIFINYILILFFLVLLNYPVVSILSLIIIGVSLIIYHFYSFKTLKINFQMLIFVIFVSTYFFDDLLFDSKSLIDFSTIFIFYILGDFLIKKAKNEKLELKYISLPIISLSLFIISSFIYTYVTNRILLTSHIFDLWRNSPINSPILGVISVLIIPIYLRRKYFNFSKFVKLLILSLFMFTIIFNIVYSNRFAVIISFIIILLDLVLTTNFKYINLKSNINIMTNVLLLVLIVIIGYYNNFPLILRFLDEGLSSVRFEVVMKFFENASNSDYILNFYRVSSFHNMYIEIYYLSSFLSFISFTMLLIISAYKIIKINNNKILKDILVMLLIIYILAGLSESINIGSSFHFGFLFFIIGYINGLFNKSKLLNQKNINHLLNTREL